MAATRTLFLLLAFPYALVRRMQLNLNPLIILCLLGVGQALLLALVLLTTRHSNLTANRLLAAVAVTISITVSASLLSSNRYFLIYPHLSASITPLIFWVARCCFSTSGPSSKSQNSKNRTGCR